jgi:hypothetical protein
MRCGGIRGDHFSRSHYSRHAAELWGLVTDVIARWVAVNGSEHGSHENSPRLRIRYYGWYFDSRV